MSYPALLSGMMDAILTGDTAPAAALLRGRKDFPAEARLLVYTQGYRIRLMEALESAYPALSYYLGKPAFAALAGGFIAAHPSRHFNLDKYTIGFAPYIAGANEDGFAGELAALEGAIHGVYQGEETPALDAGWAARQTPETLAGTALFLRGASRLLAFDYPVEEYFSAFRGDEKPQKPALEKNWLIVLRHKHQVRRLALEEAEYAMLSLLAEGMTLAQVLEDERMESYLERADFSAALQSWLARWVGEGMLRQPS